jgi:hypothetical protein
MSCYCDYESPEFYSEKQISRARTQHKCNECHRQIMPGEAYQSVSGKWDGDFYVNKTCAHCLELKNYVQAHVPCFCWAFGELIESAMETIRGYANIAPGLLFGAYRRQVAIKHAKLEAKILKEKK